MQREGGPVCKEQQVGVCVCTEGNKNGGGGGLPPVARSFFISFSDSVCTERVFFSILGPRERSYGRLNELLNPSSSSWQSLYRERELLAATVLLLFLFFSPL